MQISPEQLRPRKSKLLLCATWLLMAAAMTNVALAQPADKTPTQSETEARTAARVQTNLESYFRALGFDEAPALATALTEAKAQMWPLPDEQKTRGRLYGSLKNPTISPTQRLVNLGNFQEAMQELQTRREKVWSELETRLDLANKPRLRAALLFVSPFSPFPSFLSRQRDELALPVRPATSTMVPDDFAALYDDTLKNGAEFYDLRRRQSVRNAITKALTEAGYDQKIVNLAFAFRRELETARNSREDLALVVWQTLQDSKSSDETLSRMLATYDSINQKARADVQHAQDEFLKASGADKDPSLAIVLTQKGLGLEAPDFPNLYDWLSFGFWFDSTHPNA